MTEVLTWLAFCLQLLPLFLHLHLERDGKPGFAVMLTRFTRANVIRQTDSPWVVPANGK
ncbi:MAG TPA: hypothetical protein VF397_17520 [Pyrinomonadaceae bacterium]